MHCPRCNESTLHACAARQGTMVDVCSHCHGLWLDGGAILEFTSQPRELEEQLEYELAEQQPSSRNCPRCRCTLERGQFLSADALTERCPTCNGLWFDDGEVRKYSGTCGQSLLYTDENNS